MKLRTLFRNRIQSDLFISFWGLLAGGCVVVFSLFPFNTLWSFSSFSWATIGFWMCTTSLIVLRSEGLSLRAPMRASI